MQRPRKYNKNSTLPKNFYNYFDICVMEGISLARAKNAVGTKKVEGIKNLEELAPIEHLFEVFEKPVKNGIVNSYGILRRYYDDWKNDGRVPTRPQGRLRKEGYIQMKISIKESLKDEFTAMVDRANAMSTIHMTYSDMVSIAIVEAMQRRPQFLDIDKD